MVAAFFLAALLGCATRIAVPADSRWRALVAVQVPNQVLEVDVVNSTLASVASASGETSVRLRRPDVFPRYVNLPELATDADSGDHGGVPLRLRDTGPLDLTLAGARRVVRVSGGWELLVRTNVPETVISVRVTKAAAGEELKSQ